MKILVIDDEPDLLEVTLLRLKANGYETFGGGDGKEALRLANKHRPDLAILDVYLPFMNGDEVARMMKQDKALKDIPVILISATFASIPERMDKSGAGAFLTKPYEPEELISLIKKTIGE